MRFRTEPVSYNPHTHLLTATVVGTHHDPAINAAFCVRDMMNADPPLLLFGNSQSRLGQLQSFDKRDFTVYVQDNWVSPYVTDAMARGARFVLVGTRTGSSECSLGMFPVQGVLGRFQSSLHRSFPDDAPSLAEEFGCEPLPDDWWARDETLAYLERLGAAVAGVPAVRVSLIEYCES